MGLNMKKARLLIIGLLMVFIGSFFAGMVQSQWGKVKVEEIQIAAFDGSTISALLFIPQNATKDTPAPAMVTVHGYLNQKEAQSNFSVEFARRGYVVLEMDMSGHGSSEQIAGDMTRGVGDALKYVHTLSFVDKENVGIEGHSMGGWSSVTAAVQNKELVRTLFVIGSAQGNLEMGNVLGAPAIPDDAKFNYGVIFAKYDEFVGLNYFQAKAEDFVKSPTLMQPFRTDQPVELEKLYGSFEDGTARIAYMTDTSHVGEHQSQAAIAHLMNFVNQSSPAPMQLADNDQVWQWKELFTAILYIGLIVFMLGTAVFLFQTSWFGSIKQQITASKPLKPIVLIGMWIFMVAIVAFTFLPVKTWGINKYLAAWQPGNPFSQVYSNTTIVFLGMLQVIFLALFLIWHFVQGKKQGETTISYGLSTNSQRSTFSIGYIGRAFMFSLVTVGCGYLLLELVHSLFLVDARWWMFTIRTMNAERLLLSLVYFVPFLIIFAANNFITFGWLRLKDFGSERKNIAIGSSITFLINTLGLIILIVIQLIAVRTTGTVAFASGTFDQLLIVLSYGFLPLMAVLAIFSTYSYRKTGNIYLGSLISSMITTWFIVCYQPIGMPFYL